MEKGSVTTLCQEDLHLSALLAMLCDTTVLMSGNGEGLQGKHLRSKVRKKTDGQHGSIQTGRNQDVPGSTLHPFCLCHGPPVK
ncbi:hypothetical protein ILYODFUR_010979, partial [Ilyodon furcidens]